MDISEKSVTLDNISPRHYSIYKIQPMEFLLKNNIDFCRGNVIKYLLRHEYKNKFEDLKKAYVYFMNYVQHVYGKNQVDELLNYNFDVLNK